MKRDIVTVKNERRTKKRKGKRAKMLDYITNYWYIT